MSTCSIALIDFPGLPIAKLASINMYTIIYIYIYNIHNNKYIYFLPVATSPIATPLKCELITYSNSTKYSGSINEGSNMYHILCLGSDSILS